jgi:hypothetical protein
LEAVDGCCNLQLMKAHGSTVSVAVHKLIDRLDMADGDGWEEVIEGEVDQFGRRRQEGVASVDLQALQLVTSVSKASSIQHSSEVH